MNNEHPARSATCLVVEEEIEFTLIELCQACSTTEAQLSALVLGGVLEPVGGHLAEWRFAGTTLRRARVALRLTRDLELNPPAVALVLELLDDIESLRAQLARQGQGMTLDPAAESDGAYSQHVP